MKLLMIIITLSFSLNLNATCKFQNSVSSDEVKYTIQKSINVDDINGHIIRIFKTETNHKKTKKNCEDLRIVKTDFFGISDYINKNGKVTGYSIGIYDDGSKIFSRVDGVAQTPEDISKNGQVNTTITITGGTGVYKGVTGYGKGKVEFNPETGYSASSTETFYSIATK
tara:strand:+ start:11788 stop:12294 length:507 start_codon:yes stop_codon:yes gene_type:complete